MDDSGIWITYKAVKWLKNWLKPDYIGFEYGSGASTIWLAKQIKSLTSIEHNQRWYNLVNSELKTQNITNVNLQYKPEPHKYIISITQLPRRSLDFVYVDGIERLACTTLARNRIKPNGILIFDNSNRDYWSTVKEILKNWKQLSFYGLGRKGRWETSIFIKGE